MSEYNMTHTGKELDDAIAKVHSGYVFPNQAATVTKNGIYDTIGEIPVKLIDEIEVAVPVPDGYIIPSGTKNIVSNGTHDVKQYANAVVDVPVPDGYIDKSSASHFASGVVNNVTAGQKMTVTGIKDEATGEAFDIKGVLAYIQFTENSWAYPPNHASSIPAVFCFVRDNSRGFGTAIVCGAQSTAAAHVREVRFNTDVGGVSNKSNTTITFNANSFTYASIKTSMYGLLAASQWRWVAWG